MQDLTQELSNFVMSFGNFHDLIWSHVFNNEVFAILQQVHNILLLLLHRNPAVTQLNAIGIMLKILQYQKAKSKDNNSAPTMPVI